MADYRTAFNGPSPYTQTKVYSYTSDQLLQLGYKPIQPQTSEEKVLCRKIIEIVDGVKAFYWSSFKLVGVDEGGTIPAFFIHLDKNQAYYSSALKCFSFNNSYASSPEVVCHEFTHAVIDGLNPLPYQGQSGAINESIADVVGIMFKRNIYQQQDWKINEIRDLSNPFTVNDLKKDTVPTYNEEGKTTNDYGRVHHNSLLLSHAFYLCSKSIEESRADLHNTILLKIWWEAVIQLKNKTFEEFIANTIKIAEPHGFPFIEPIKKAWTKVGCFK